MNLRKFKTVFCVMLSIFMIGSVAISCSDDNDEKTIQLTQLPQAGQSFISTYFPQEQIRSIKSEKKGSKTTYDVKFISGVEIEFDHTGEWKDVDMPMGKTVPAGIVPTAIADYVSANYAGQGINEISKENYGYDVELVNGLDLKFDPQGNFLRVDK